MHGSGLKYVPPCYSWARHRPRTCVTYNGFLVLHCALASLSWPEKISTRFLDHLLFPILQVWVEAIGTKSG
jgi:hypothetical protein